MAEYKGIKGFQVQTLTEDPTPYAQALVDHPYAGAWGSGGNLNTAKQQMAGAGTTHTAALAIGGAPTPKTTNESYDGSSWTELADINTGRSLMIGAGSTTAAIIAGGYVSPNNQTVTETWNGSSWTEVNDLNTATRGAAGFGSSTAALSAGGRVPPNTNSAKNENWNGSSWTEVGDLNSARYIMAGAGTTTSGIVFGGDPSNDVVESWNGSAWTEVNELNTGRNQLAGSGASNTSALAFGGGGAVAVTESWDGSSWTEVNDLSTGREALSSSQSSPAFDALAFGGGPTDSNATEEWTFSGLDPSSTPAADYSDAIVGNFYYNSSEGKFKNTVDGISAGTWGSGGNMNTARYRMFGGFGPHSEGLVAGGQAPVKAICENYNGTSWTEVADLPTALSDSGMIGVYTAGVLAGGEYSGGSTNEALHWNGSAWTEATNMPYSVERASGSGVQTAGLVTGGRVTTSLATTLEYDGTNWTAGGSLPVAYYNIAVQGPQTSSLAAGGVGPPGSGSALAYTYNGTAWTQVNSSNTGRYESGWATQGDGATRGLIFGGNDAPARPTTEFYNGTSWTELNDLSTGRAAGGSFGGVNNSVYAGGSSPALSPTTSNATEEWSASDFLNKLVTSS